MHRKPRMRGVWEHCHIGEVYAIINICVAVYEYTVT